MSFTYTTLKDALKNYTQNTEELFLNSMDMFIRLAEERILKSTQLNVFQKNVTGTLLTGSPYLAVPSDFLSPHSLSVTNNSLYEYLQLKELEFVQSYNPNSATTGTPKYYGQFDVNYFVIAPTPDSTYTVDLSYFYRPSSLTSSQYLVTMNNVSGTFVVTETITGGTSGQSSTISVVESATSLTVGIPSQNYTVGETITGATSGATGVITAVGADTTNSWLSENAEVALLYASLAECYLFMKGEQDVMNMYNQRYGEAINRLKNLGEALEVTDDYSAGYIKKART
tara:strand:+ start:1240 stop:2094 length:855 start_codon:yes stop_codon:yes gene_type:complete